MPVWITTSWDDGHVHDSRIADLLDRYGLTGTFYIAREYLPLERRLSEQDIAQLADRHEIGAHTLTHPLLTMLTPVQAAQEICGSKQWLEDVTGRAITAFCYPRGAHNATVRRLTAAAGFTAARTVEAWRLDAGDDPLALPTSVQVYPFPLRPTDSWRARYTPLRRALAHWPLLGFSVQALRNWSALAQTLLGRAARTGGVWHLWGHSWEVERNGMWDALEEVLAAAARLPEARPVTNSGLVQALWSQTDERATSVL